jgi:hypothetical protein
LLVDLNGTDYRNVDVAATQSKRAGREKDGGHTYTTAEMRIKIPGIHPVLQLKKKYQ